jgi:hypothetical protein
MSKIVFCITFPAVLKPLARQSERFGGPDKGFAKHRSAGTRPGPPNCAGAKMPLTRQSESGNGAKRNDQAIAEAEGSQGPGAHTVLMCSGAFIQLFCLYIFVHIYPTLRLSLSGILHCIFYHFAQYFFKIIYVCFFIHSFTFFKFNHFAPFRITFRLYTAGTLWKFALKRTKNI